MIPRSQLIATLKDRSLKIGNFTLASGEKSRYYVDCRLTTMSAEGMALVGSIGLQMIRDAGWAPAAAGGLTLGADPVSYAIAMASNQNPPVVDAFTVRKEPKGHGTRSAIEGCLPETGSVVVVEDVITTGGSALRAIEKVDLAGVRIDGVIAVVDRQAGGRERIEAAGYPCLAMVTLDDLGLDRP